MSALHDYK